MTNDTCSRTTATGSRRASSEGDGAFLYDQDGRRYIDFFSGIAVTGLGHSRAGLSKRLHSQVDRLIHTSNWFYNREQVEAARLLSRLAFPGRTLFVNSGTEANEAAIKLARKYGQSLSPERFEILSFEGSFHGRTFGSMSATGQEKIRAGFGPLVPGFTFLPFNDAGALRKKLVPGARVCAVITELVQGEGGIRPMDAVFAKELSRACADAGTLLIVDEIQTGMGRTGRAFCFKHFGIVPDMITIAKGLGGGVPVGALHARAGLVKYLEKGAHGTTFGGNHLACAAAAHVLKELEKKSLLEGVLRSGGYIVKRLRALQRNLPLVKEVRGLGLHIGIELNKPGAGLVKKALARGLVINCTSERVIRIMPPLTISMKAVREGMDVLEKLLEQEDGIP